MRQMSMTRQISDRFSLARVTRKQCRSTAFSLLLIVLPVVQLSAQQVSKQVYDVPVVLSQIDTHTYISDFDYSNSNPNASALERTRYSVIEEKELVQNLGADNFQLRVGGMPADFQAISVDKGPKRINLTLDASVRVSKQQWEWELGGVERILGNARSIDKFAFALAGAGPATSTFMSLGESRKYLRSLRTARPATVVSEAKVYDALLTAAKGLDPPQFGDAVIFFGLGKDSGSEATVADLEHLFLKGRIRFYGLTFLPGDVYKPDAILPFFPDPGLVSLSEATGCNFWVTSTGVDYGFWYRSISEPYRLSVTSTTVIEASLEITLLSGRKKRKLSGITIQYPRFITP